MHKPIEITFFHDVLCSWCYVADARLRALKQEFGDELRISLRSYPLRPQEQIPDKKHIASLVRHVRRASTEPEGRILRPDLWRAPDIPLSSLPALQAVEAAGRQDHALRDLLLHRLREAAFVHGLNVARTDVIFEMAAAIGLEMGRFVRSFHSPATLAAIENSHSEAVGRGVKAIPAIAIGDEWLLTGVRPLEEYREVLQRWRTERGRPGGDRIVH